MGFGVAWLTQANKHYKDVALKTTLILLKKKKKKPLTLQCSPVLAGKDYTLTKYTVVSLGAVFLWKTENIADRPSRYNSSQARQDFPTQMPELSPNCSSNTTPTIVLFPSAAKENRHRPETVNTQ